MISILIPVYNFDVRKLVANLDRLGQSMDVPYEIWCLDDASDRDFQQINASIGEKESVFYEQLSENIGRSSIRNLLAERANYPYLIFMDCDAAVVREDYLEKYVAAIQPDTLLYGGHVYTNTPPDDPQLYLHWYYGRHREVLPLDKRRSAPYHSFKPFNFLVPRDIFLQIRFDSRLKKYGHEDTLFGIELKKRAIKVVHLDNPLEHLGLEKAEVFLEKSLRAIENLYFLYRQDLGIETRLLSLFRRLEKNHLTFPAYKLLGLLDTFFYNNLLSASPKLRYFDLWKLYRLTALARRDKV